MDDEIFLGYRHTYGGFKAPFFLPTAALKRHAYVIGQSGTGKSTLLKIMIRRMIELGHGVGVMDPHGDLAEWALDAVPQSRLDDVVYLDFGDKEFSPSLNFVSDSVPLSERPQLASALVSAFRHVWASSWGPRLEHILYHSLRVLIDCQNASLVALPRLLTDDAYRSWAVNQCKDPFIRAFWSLEYDAWDRRFRAEAIAPVLNKLGQLAAFPPLRQVLGQVKLKVDLRRIMDGKKILVVNLSKGTMGEDAAKLLGALLSSSIAAAAMERTKVPDEDRNAFTLFMDEAHAFLTEAMATALSESRKFGLHLVLAHQFLGQLSPGMREAIFGNAGTIFSFRVSGTDAGELAPNYPQPCQPELFSELPPYTALIRLPDVSGQAVRIAVVQKDVGVHGFRKEIANGSRHRYGSKRSDIEDKLHRWR